ncbi:MAG: hypothetical protein U0324_40755 [Polyangiales bacterium]
MTPLTDDERRALGIDPAVVPSPRGDDRATDDGVGRGFSNPPAEPEALTTLRAQFASFTFVEGFAVTAAALGAPEATVARADRQRGLYQLDPVGLAIDVIGDAHAFGGCWYVDARRGRVLVRARGLTRDCLLRFEGDVFEWFDLPAAATPAVAPPLADALLGGFDAPAWLTAPLAQAPREDPFAVFAAVGTVGRLWAPRGTSTTPAEALARLMAGDDPMARARRWADAAPAEVRDAVARLASVEADVLADALDALDDAPDDALRWLERRDDLASVARLLAPAPDAPLSRALAALDRRAVTHASLWRMLSPLRSPRLDAVAWQEPDAWWAAPARAT